MVDAASAGAAILLSPIKALKTALQNIEEIEEMHPLLCERVEAINYVIQSFQSGQPMKEEVCRDLMSDKKCGQLKSILEKVVERLKDAKKAEKELTKKLQQKLRLWDRTEHLRTMLEDAHQNLDYVHQVLQVLQDQRVNDKLDKLAEHGSKIDELMCLVQERMTGASDEPKGYLRYNANMMRFLQSQITLVKGLDPMPPDGVQEENLENWKNAFEILQQTIDIGEAIIMRHQRRFNLRTFYTVQEAKEGIKMICADLIKFYEEWGKYIEKLKDVEIKATVPDDVLQRDVKDMEQKLDFILNTHECKFPETVQQEWEQQEWEDVRAQHQTRLQQLPIIDECDINWVKQIAENLWHAKYLRTIPVIAERVVSGDKFSKNEAFAKLYTKMAIVNPLQPPFVARYYGLSRNGLVLLEQCEKSLADWRRTHETINLEFKLNVLFKAAQGLEFVHKSGLIHRDISSHSFLIFEDCTVKISNFGCAIAVADVRKVTIRHLFPWPWTAPEISMEKPHSQASDVFSFGVIMYEVVSQATPYGANTSDADILEKKKRGEQPCNNLNGCPEELTALMKSCISPVPVARPAMTTVVDTLDWILKNIDFKSSN